MVWLSPMGCGSDGKEGHLLDFCNKAEHAILPTGHDQESAEVQIKNGFWSGHHVVMKANMSGVDVFILTYAWSSKRAAYIVSSCGTTVQHEIPYRTHFTDEFGNVTFKIIPCPSIAYFYFELCPLVDNHNKDRYVQHDIVSCCDCLFTAVLNHTT